jgi:hypothetical protein
MSNQDLCSWWKGEMLRIPTFQEYSSQYNEECQGCYLIRDTYNEDYGICMRYDSWKQSPVDEHMFLEDDGDLFYIMCAEKSPVKCPCVNCLMKPKCSQSFSCKLVDIYLESVIG